MASKAFMSNRKGFSVDARGGWQGTVETLASYAYREAERILSVTTPKVDYLGIETCEVALSLHAPWMLRGACYSALADGIRSFLSSEGRDSNYHECQCQEHDCTAVVRCERPAICGRPDSSPHVCAACYHDSEVR